jgi:hypothetical protein
MRQNFDHGRADARRNNEARPLTLLTQQDDAIQSNKAMPLTLLTPHAPAKPTNRSMKASWHTAAGG